jgi:NAD(P)-dependent dehydrogenase (short-subunit alcohol dehydrogenase family)
MLLNKKTALVTGAGRGIGRAITLAYAREGADVAVVSRTRTELERVAEEVGAFGRRALVIVADIADPVDVRRMVEETLTGFGQIDILVNNAAIAGPKKVIDLPLPEWQQMLDVNLTGVFLGSQAVLQHMIERRQGKIINISSGSGLRGSPSNAAYSAAKAGVIRFTEALAGEVREFGIMANVICPGPIKTEMLASRPGSGPADESNFLEPEDVAGAALFLASEHSGQMTAQIIQVRNSNRW